MNLTQSRTLRALTSTPSTYREIHDRYPAANNGLRTNFEKLHKSLRDLITTVWVKRSGQNWDLHYITEEGKRELEADLRWREKNQVKK